MTKLKPCPFCGGEADLTHWVDDYGTFTVVVCMWCFGQSQRRYFAGDDEKAMSEQIVIERWNRRANNDKT